MITTRHPLECSSNFEDRATSNDSEPQTSWAMGNAGIVRESLHFVRIVEGRSSDYYVARSGHSVTGPRAL